ncbi:DUF6007 family protein [Staphylococcus coagulans]|uniref:DUF6007 family protein n=1 Tax=Staphylococcus coagulans TaxID=74706 RepID=UPI003CCA1382
MRKVNILNHLDEALKELGWLDLIFVIPMFFLFSYLPSDHLWQLIVNIIIIIFFSIGLSIIIHSLFHKWIKKDKP